MKLPLQSRPVERKTYDSNAAAVGAHASFDWAGLAKIGLSTLPQVAGLLGK